MNSISLTGAPSAAPGNPIKSTGLPTKRTSAGLQGNPGKNGATCSTICPPRTARERFTASLRIRRISSSFTRRSERFPSCLPIRNTAASSRTDNMNRKNACAAGGKDKNAV
jgi:hypothetical protein